MTLPTAVYLLAAAALIVYVYTRRVYGTWKRRGLNYLEPQFFFGNSKRMAMREISRGELYTEIYNNMKFRGWKHGGYFEIIRPMYMPIDLDLVKSILQTDFWHFCNHGYYSNEKDEPLSANLLNLEDEKWRTTRAKLTPAFSSGKLRMMFQVMSKCSEPLGDVLRDIEKGGEPMDAKDVLSRFSIDVIGNVGFGIECNSLKNPNSLFVVYCKRIFELDSLKMLKRMATGIIPRSILRFLHLKNADPELAKFFSDIVAKTVDYREEKRIYRKDFMHQLLQLKNIGRITDDDYVPSKEVKGEYISHDELCTHCVTFFAAGFESSATTMTFALYELAKKLISETLRRHPATSGLSRVCTKSYQVPGTQVFLKPGDKVVVPIMAIHMDPEYYPEPEKFDPERFSEKVKSKRHPMAYLPFGKGQRQCIGLRFGVLEAKIGLVAIISKFKLTLNKKTESPVVYAVDSEFNSTRSGIWLDVHEIK
nr:unnamed protein product [Callosobruchus chinensis]